MNKLVFVFGISIIVAASLYSAIAYQDLTHHGNTQQSQTKMLAQLYSNNIYDKCLDDDSCLIDELYLLKSTNSTESVIETMDQLLSIYQDAPFYCHHVAHHMGEFLYGFTESDLKMASQLADYRCARGVLHGILENTIQLENMFNDKEIEQVDIVKRCSDLGKYLDKASETECAHGIGHSVIKIYDYNTTKAIERCDQFAENNLKIMCNGGLFMQNMKEYSKTRGGDFSNDSIFYPCDQISENDKASSMCYRYQANYFLSKTNYNIDTAKELCQNIPDSKYIGICLKGISSHISKNNFDDLDKTKKMCDDYPVNYQDRCIIGAVESLTRFVDEQKANEFCDMHVGDFHKKCTNRLNQLLDLR